MQNSGKTKEANQSLPKTVAIRWHFRVQIPCLSQGFAEIIGQVAKIPEAPKRAKPSRLGGGGQQRETGIAEKGVESGAAELSATQFGFEASPERRHGAGLSEGVEIVRYTGGERETGKGSQAGGPIRRIASPGKVLSKAGARMIGWATAAQPPARTKLLEQGIGIDGA